jgi:hypothetical protein
VNGDGRADIVAGAPSANRFVGSYIPADTHTGRVFVVFGSSLLRNTSFPAGALNGTNGFTLVGANSYDFLGSTVAVGDINGDGINDIVVSTYPFPGTTPQVYVIFGKTSPWPAFCHISQMASSEFILLHTFGYGGAGGASARSIAIADVDGDGANDIIIGWPDANGGVGATYVVFNKALQVP